MIQSKPIKGTSKRNLEDVIMDNKVKQILSNDEKSQAENLMIVDLVRNDFGRICQVGTVQVPKLMNIETFRYVHQMVNVYKHKYINIHAYIHKQI